MSSTTTDSEWWLGHKRRTGWSVFVLCLSRKEKKLWPPHLTRISLLWVLSLRQMNYVNELQRNTNEWETGGSLRAFCPVPVHIFISFTAFKVRVLGRIAGTEVGKCANFVFVEDLVFDLSKVSQLTYHVLTSMAWCLRETCFLFLQEKEKKHIISGERKEISTIKTK